MNEKFISPAQREPSILDSTENQIKLYHRLENVYEDRPDVDSFVGAMSGTKFENDYTKEAIEKNKQYVERIRNKIDESNSNFGRERLDNFEGGFQLSEIFQAMIVDRIKHWFKDCKAIMTADYDDIAAGMDAVIQHEKGYLGLSLDFTVTNQDKILYEKNKKNYDTNIVEGKIPVVKFFEDPVTKEKGRLLVPKFIIGASKKDVEELANAYLSNNTEVLDNHPFKYLMLLQIEEQLQTVFDYYESNTGDPKIQFAKKQYERIQTILRNMKNEIQSDEKMHENTDLYEYTKTSVALDMMRRFRVMRENKAQ